jgi:hypothetical protein
MNVINYYEMMRKEWKVVYLVLLNILTSFVYRLFMFAHIFYSISVAELLNWVPREVLISIAIHLLHRH